MPKNLTTASEFCIFVVLFEEQFLRQRASANFSVCTSKVSCAKAQKWSENSTDARRLKTSQRPQSVELTFNFNLKNYVIMALKVKANERLQKIGKYAGSYRYQLMPDLYTALTQEKVIREAALRSGVSQGVMQACWDAAGEVIKAWATEGHSVALPGLGSMRFGLRAKTVADVNEVKTSLIKSRRIIFTPAAELKNELSSTAIQITCYDRDGELVKRVTSTDAGTVEDTTDGGNITDDENGGGNSGGSSTTGGSEDNPGGGLG